MNTLWIITDCCNNAARMAAAPIIKEGTNDCNVLIAAIVCISLVLVALIAAVTVSHWHKKELDKKPAKNSCQSEPSQQEKDKKEYIGKLISFREELSKKDSKLKGTDDLACQEYIELLTCLAGLDKQ